MLYPGQALLPDHYIYIEVTLNQETMPAVRLLRWQSEPELVTVPAPEPGPGEVLVKVEAAGLCHSDLQAAAPRRGARPGRGHAGRWPVT